MKTYDEIVNILLADAGATFRIINKDEVFLK